jgi:cytoskeletal protein CcmA (bactofilin family)
MFRRDHDDDREGRVEPIQPKEVRMAEQVGADATVVGQGAKLEGTVESAGSLRVDGRVKGTINADGDVHLSPQSEVEADINATNVTVAGRFKGSILARNRAELARGGRVEGNVTSKTLVVAEGAIFSGQSTMTETEGRPAAAPTQAPRPEAAETAMETTPTPVRR